MAFSKDTIRRLIIALTSSKAAAQVIGASGLYGGGVLNSDATVKLSAGDFTVIPDSGGAAGTYRLIFSDSTLNAKVQSIDWFEVAGFTPRTPTTAETCVPRATGYNFDATLNQWYITVQIAKLSDNTVDATPPANFVIGCRAAVTLLETSYRL